MTTYTDEQLAELWADSPHLIQIRLRDNNRLQVTALPIRLDMGEYDMPLALIYRDKIGWSVTDVHTGLSVGVIPGFEPQTPHEAIDAARCRIATSGYHAYADRVESMPAINDDLPESEIVL